jgi:DNA-binding NarL/FixJ family response regulator
MTSDGTSKSIRVLVVDDYEPWHAFVSSMLRDQPELQIVAHVFDGLEAVEQAQQLQPDIILLDVGLPSLNGIEAALRIREVAPVSKILFASINRPVEVVQAAMNAGACGYLVKSDAGRELLPALRAVLEGKRFISASLTTQFKVMPP